METERISFGIAGHHVRYRVVAVDKWHNLQGLGKMLGILRFDLRFKWDGRKMEGEALGIGRILSTIGSRITPVLGLSHTSACLQPGLVEPFENRASVVVNGSTNEGRGGRLYRLQQRMSLPFCGIVGDIVLNRRWSLW